MAAPGVCCIRFLSNEGRKELEKVCRHISDHFVSRAEAAEVPITQREWAESAAMWAEDTRWAHTITINFGAN